MTITQRLKRLFAKDTSVSVSVSEPGQDAPSQPETERAGGMCPDWGEGKVLHWSGRRVVQATDPAPEPATWPPKPPAIPAEPPIPEFLRKG